MAGPDEGMLVGIARIMNAYPEAFGAQAGESVRAVVVIGLHGPAPSHLSVRLMGEDSDTRTMMAHALASPTDHAVPWPPF